MQTATAATTARPETSDRARQVLVLVGAVLAIGGAAFGSGAFGGQQVADAAGGALSADATPIAPATPAFSIWSLIYLGLAVVAVAQALPGQATSPRFRATAWWVLASMLLNAAWIGVVQAGWLAASLLVILVLLAVLARLFVVLVRMPPRGVADVVTDVTVGLYLGWVSVATLANVTAYLTDAGVGARGPAVTGWSVVVLAAAAALAVGYAMHGRGRASVVLPVGAAMAWGLAWIGVGRQSPPFEDGVVALAAFAAAVVALGSAVVASVVRRRHT
ncbi:tryptophan-rich sensory protein [Cellulomonas sp.]|uniref:tryptophan-rich sensory protein n=1 Tax=Cellulomonas sp. TaxID=40001 RepID=UPI001B2297F9|nr:tryptophan-rich sensory protein [Cellulomonas sp.]MBO9555171.1 tryptophan-rich sensory protein [Cellulomonas sp.]